MTPALRWTRMKAILLFHNCEGQSHKTVSTDHNFRRERRAEADSNRGPSAYQPNALPLGQTGSQSNTMVLCSVSRFGLAGKQRDLGSNLLRLSLLFKICGLWTLSCDSVPHNYYETLKRLSSLPVIMQESFWW